MAKPCRTPQDDSSEYQAGNLYASKRTGYRIS